MALIVANAGKEVLTALLDAGVSVSEAARRYEISRSALTKIVKNAECGKTTRITLKTAGNLRKAFGKDVVTISFGGEISG